MFPLKEGKKAESKLTVRKSGGNGYDSYWIYVPSKLSKDSTFPFTPDDTLIIEMREDSLKIRKREVFADIINEFGLENATLPKLIEMKAEEFGKKRFLLQGEKSFTFNKVNSLSNRIANGLLDVLERENMNKCNIALLFPNCPYYIITWFGIVKTGSVFVPINQYFKDKALSYLLVDSDTEILIIDHKFYDNYKNIEKYLPKLKKVILKNAPSDFQNFSEKLIDFNDLISNDKSTPDVKLSYKDPMEIIYTEGSTGNPKGVYYRHQKILSGLILSKESQKYSKFEKVYCPIPLFHYFAQLVTVMQSLVLGSTIVIPEKFNPSLFWEDIRKHDCTMFIYHAAIIKELMKQPPRDGDRSHPIKWALGGETPKELWEPFEDRFGLTLLEGWGCTEAIGFMFNSLGSKGGKTGSIGKPIEEFKCKIVDDANNELAPDPSNIGEIAIKSTLPIIFEYFKEPKSSFMEKDSNGYIHTRDMGYKDKDGYIYYVGRKSDMIKRGEDYLPIHRIENVAKLHPHVLDCAVIGVPADKSDELDIKICIVAVEGKLTHEDIHNYLKEHLAYYLVPKYIEFKKRLRDLTGRFRKFKLREEWQNDEIRKNTWDASLKG